MRKSGKQEQETRGRVRLKRAYDAMEPDDGLRVLVDRLWPRGLRKEEAGIDLWLKEIAPSNGLRRWFGHDPARWKVFRRKYQEELQERSELLQTLQEALHRSSVTLLFAARDEEHNNAVVIKGVLDGK
ncbi:DUF488 domain-containing protein [Rhodospirillaceae bacterium SYSU D60014]|uniref:DUF488 domain-containing protein n=1 Tax=Virgifigura deserti TaxID=2268457 RepID=UPI000E66EAE3